MKLIDETVRGFRVAKIFRENSDRVSSINFSANGETLISSSDDDSIVIYDCLNGTWVACLFVCFIAIIDQRLNDRGEPDHYGAA